MGSSALKTIHIDAGEKTNITDCAGRPIEARDAKGALVLSIYDEGSRPTFAWARDKTSEDVTLRGYTAYGDNNTDVPTPTVDNLNGKVYQQYDEAGMSEMPLYDFKGNMLTNLRQFISDTELLSVFSPPPVNWEVECYRVDWLATPTSVPPILDARIFETNSEYDALNRVTKVTYPEDTDSERKIGIPTYNKAGALQSMEFDGDIYVNHIAYNAKGQRLLIAYGNTQMTRYTYDNLTFRLQRLRTEKYDQTGWTFSVLSGNTRQDYAYFYDLVGNIVEMNDRTPDCGIVGSALGVDALNRNFIYDPLYRLLTADGRENIPTSNYPWWDDSYRSDDASTTSSYTQNYEYDKIGNILELAHTAASSGDNFTRTFDYNTTNNFLTGITVGTGIGTYTYDYDEVGNQVKENTTRNYEWDHSNNMRCFFNQAGTSEPTIYAQYLYAGGQRVKKLVRTSGGGYESTIYVGGAYEYKTDGTDEQNTLHIGSTASMRTGDSMGDSAPAIKYNLEDVLGSSMTLLDDIGDFVNREEYYPFGETSFGSYELKRYRFQGKEKDTESGLYYFGARYYCAANCRFVSVDAVVQPGESSYAGMGNNPVRMEDPDGNMALDGTDTTGSNAETNAKKNIGMPTDPKQGDTWTHTGSDGSKWGYMYDETNGWIGTGASVDLKEFVFSESTGKMETAKADATYAAVTVMKRRYQINDSFEIDNSEYNEKFKQDNIDIDMNVQTRFYNNVGLQIDISPSNSFDATDFSEIATENNKQVHADNMERAPKNKKTSTKYKSYEKSGKINLKMKNIPLAIIGTVTDLLTLKDDIDEIKKYEQGTFEYENAVTVLYADIALMAIEIVLPEVGIAIGIYDLLYAEYGEEIEKEMDRQDWEKHGYDRTQKGLQGAQENAPISKYRQGCNY
jgi:RHS repeat-associated protein